MRTFIATVALIGLLAAPATAATEKTVTKKSAVGDYAITQVSATIKNPKRIRVRVVASPSQKVSLTWLIMCSKGFSSSSKSGQQNVAAPHTRTLSHPMLSKADSCIVSANSQLAGSGKITLSVLATKR